MNIKEVAKRAGVSIATVSRVINNTAKVSDGVRTRVEEVIRETAFVPNSLAKELQKNRTNTIGIILSVQLLNINSLGSTINSISDLLKKKGYIIMLANSRFDIDEELEYFKTYQKKRVDGILYFAVSFTQKHYDLLQNYPIPIVLIGQENRLLDIPCVLHDNFHGAKEATSHLIEMGHRRIAFIGLPHYDEAASIERRGGYETAMNLNKIPINPDYIATGDFSIQSGYNCIGEILKRSQIPPTALFASTDFMAIGAMHYLFEHGYRVPEDISIVGFDDVEISSFLNPPLTTIHTDNDSVGYQAANLLLDVLEGKEPHVKKFIANYKLMERGSVKRIEPSID